MAESFARVDRPATEPAWKRLHRVMDRATPEVRQAVESALLALSRAIPLDELVDILARGDTFRLGVISAGLRPRLQRAVAVLEQVFLSGVQVGMLQLPRSVRVGMAFNVTNPFAVEAARQSAAQLVTNISASTQSAIRRVVAQAFAEQVPVRDLARLVRPMIGLTDRQAMAVINARFRWLEEGRSAAEVQRLAERYAQKQLRRRALTIARTETARAAVDGQVASWQAAQAEGLLSLDAAKEWIVTPDDRLCPVCAPMEGATAPVAGVFVTAAGAVAGPPAHPNCRCALGVAASSLAARRAA